MQGEARARRDRRIASGLAALLLSAACAGAPPVAETENGGSRIGKFVWFDLLTEDPEAARRFYSALFGWTFEGLRVPGSYTLIRHEGVAIGGIARHADRSAEAPESLWIASLSVADVDRGVELTRARGGEILDAPRSVAGRGRMAVVRDPAGALLVLLRAAGGDPGDAVPPEGRWMWTDLWTRDLGGARDFYAALVGYETRDVRADDQHVVHVMLHDGIPRAGVIELPAEPIEPHWLPYVRVADLDAALARASSLGGRLLVRDADAAVVVDPTGAAVGIQTRERHRSGR